MTEIHFKHDTAQTDVLGLGHCNAGRGNGNDLCCCAVSTLVYTLLEALSRLNLKSYKGKYGGGWCHIGFSAKSPDIKRASECIKTVFAGFELLQQNYPSSIKIYSKP